MFALRDFSFPLMNYLAHLALSHDNSDIMLGNFIGDFIKGDNYSRYSPRVRTGILLHRKIDTFTDQHPIVKESTAILRPSYGHYAGVITDMFYDHFLARNWDEFHPSIKLSRFVNRTHKILLLNYFRLPGEAKRLLPFLIKSRRLENYGTLGGLARALNIMSRNTSLPNLTSDAIGCLKDNYETFEAHFRAFFPEITAMVDEEIKDFQEND